MKQSSSSSSSKPTSVLPYKTPNLRDHYRIGKKLGQGDVGSTYLCIDKSEGKEYACKFFPKNKLVCRKDYEDVWREIQIMHHLSEHPNVVRIKGPYEDALFVYWVMELCAGGDLFDRITQKGHYTEIKAAQLIKTIVSVVEECHSLGVMHRDLKPENFLFASGDEDSALKVTDFGSSVFYMPGDVFYDVVGSPYYVAPEVLRKYYGPESDVWSAGVILYILLSGVPPFWAASETEAGIFKQILRGPLDFESEPWPCISYSAKDLLHNMLNRDPEMRFTAHEVLCHPWIVDAGMAPDKPLDSAVLSRLKQFSAMNKLKKMALRVITENLLEEEIGGLKSLFRLIDTDNSGTITYDEHKVGLKRVGSELMESEIQALMDAADMNNSGTIDYGEFLAATLHTKKLEREENLINAFSFFDKDGSGYITIDILSQACGDFGLGEVYLEDVIKEIDQNNDGQIDYSEFVAMMRKGTGGSGGTDNLKMLLDQSEQSQLSNFRDKWSSLEVFYLDIKKATNGFNESSKIGSGGYGSVYKGKLGGTMVAIKMLDSKSKQGLKEFSQELEVLYQMRHPNLVKLIGACFEKCALVYEYLLDGSLEDCLEYSPNLLTWQMHTRIIYEICSALIHLHSRSVVHDDLKPANILLDANFKSKLADFGLCRVLPQNMTTDVFLETVPKGTSGYIDPWFLETSILRPGSDFYSFGITILKLLTRLPPVGLGRKARDVDENSFRIND